MKTALETVLHNLSMNAWPQGNHSVFHDNRHEYNPPMVTAPAMSQDQFEYDNEMDKELLRMSNPLILAREVWMLRERVKELENDNRSRD